MTMEVKINMEIELNRGWILDEDEEEIGETNFVVSLDFLKELWSREEVRKEFGLSYEEDDFSSFLDWYDPDVEGQIIYDIAKREGKLVEDIGVVMY